MTLRLFPLISCFVFLLACRDDEPKVCSVENPVEDLAWLKAATEELAHGGMPEYQYVLRAEHNSSTVFVFGNCCISCSSVFFVYNCAGEKIGSVNDGNIDASIIEKRTVVWKAQNSACNF